ncbi:polyketide synthase docking domain-containing protein [Pseudomonas sp. 10C3]
MERQRQQLQSDLKRSTADLQQLRRQWRQLVQRRLDRQ